jgi:hypothetical protein
MQKTVNRMSCIALVPLLLAACAPLRWQTAEESSPNIYAGLQEKARQDCMKNRPGQDVAECVRQNNASYEQYKKERNKIAGEKPLPEIQEIYQTK